MAAFTTCFVVAIAVSLMTAPHPVSELGGGLCSLTPRPVDEVRHWHERPAVLAGVVVVLLVWLNILTALTRGVYP